MWIEASPEPTGGRVESAPADVVAAAFKAFRQQDRTAVLAVIHPDVEFRAVSGLGLIGETRRGAQAALDWFDEMDQDDSWLLASPRTIEDMGNGWVLAAGTMSEKARGGGRFAAIVAWLFRVREGRIQSAIGYPSEGEARRALRDSTS
jgi:ketosteroid isomerase-like protein